MSVAGPHRHDPLNWHLLPAAGIRRRAPATLRVSADKRIRDEGAAGYFEGF
ncbi:MAG: hypothetical protein ACRDJV_01135 [Actinomycetota bacterium]